MAGREGIICRSQTPHTPPHTLRTSLAGKPVINSRSLDAASDSHWPSRPVGGEVRAELQPRRRPREPICRGRGAGVGTRARRGRAARGREGRHAEGTREAEEAARASGTGRRGAWHLQRVHDRLGARSSAMTKATTQPAVRAEGRSPRRALHPRGGSRREPLSSVDGRARAWMGQDGEAVADAPHASSRARRVERRLVGASVGAFGCRNASTACQRDVDGSIQATCIVTGW